MHIKSSWIIPCTTVDRWQPGSVPVRWAWFRTSTWPKHSTAELLWTRFDRGTGQGRCHVTFESRRPRQHRSLWRWTTHTCLWRSDSRSKCWFSEQYSITNRTICQQQWKAHANTNGKLFVLSFCLQVYVLFRPILLYFIIACCRRSYGEYIL